MIILTFLTRQGILGKWLATVHSASSSIFCCKLWSLAKTLYSYFVSLATGMYKLMGNANNPLLPSHYIKLWFLSCPAHGSHHTLNIPEIVSVKLDVWDSSRNSATLIMKARKQPNITMAMVTQRVELSCALNSLGDRAKRCPAINKKVQLSFCLNGWALSLPNSLDSLYSDQTTCSLSRISDCLPL